MSTGELATTAEANKPWRYDRKVTRFFSRASEDALTLDADGRAPRSSELDMAVSDRMIIPFGAYVDPAADWGLEVVA